jgi:hypothetical protein
LKNIDLASLLSPSPPPVQIGHTTSLGGHESVCNERRQKETEEESVDPRHHILGGDHMRVV